MEIEGLEGQQAEQPQQEQPPQQPSIDPRLALEIAARELYQTTPDFLEGAVRLQDENRRVAEEMRRRQRELELREARAEALERANQRYQAPEPSYDGLDPAVRPVFDEVRTLKQMILDERKERADQERRMEAANQRAAELDNHFQSLMRSVPTQNQMNPQRFYGAMQELWPEGPPPGISAERAVGITARYLGLNPNGGAPLGAFDRQPNINPRDPRAQYVVPVGNSAPGASPAAMSDTGPQRPGESLEQYTQRLLRVLQENGTRGLLDGQKVSSG